MIISKSLSIYRRSVVEELWSRSNIGREVKRHHPSQNMGKQNIILLGQIIAKCYHIAVSLKLGKPNAHTE